jgi:competence protein ComEC
MRRDVLGLLLGIIAAHCLPQLPHLNAAWPVITAICLPLLWRCQARTLAIAVFGFCWTCWRVGTVLEQRLPETLEPLAVVARVGIDSLVAQHGLITSFDAEIFSSNPSVRARRVRIAWFSAAVLPQPGETWQFDLTLKSPRATRNTAAADQELQWLISHIEALASVKRSGGKRIALAGWRSPVLLLRSRLAQALRDCLGASPAAGVVSGLAIGDASGVPEHLWQVFRKLGITHLMAISGSHVGFFGLLAAAVARQVWRVTRRWCRGGRVDRWCAVWAASACFGYALLAGFSVPTQRTAVMVSAAAAATLSQRKSRVSVSLACGLFAVLVWDPLAVLQAGFWLSFATVCWIFALSGGALSHKPWRQAIELQVGISLFLAPICCALFGQVSLVGPVVNLVAIPLCEVVIVPTILGAIAVWPLSPTLAQWLLKLVARVLDASWPALDHLASQAFADWYAPSLPPGVLALAFGGALLVGLAPRANMRLLGMAGLCFMAWPRNALRDGEFDLTIFDVGQGLATVLRTRTHALVFDTGPRYASGRDAGASVLVPYLQSARIERVDLVVLSHTHLDHAGGFASLAAALPIRASLVGDGSPRCARGQEFAWDGVRLEMLNPLGSQLAGNDASCVLRVSSAFGSALLTGDISARAEFALLGFHQPLRTDLVLVPHHGSRGASSQEFVDAVKPRFAVISAGHLNRFHFPDAQVAERWRKSGAEWRQVAERGAMVYAARAGGLAQLSAGERITARHYWTLQ